MRAYPPREHPSGDIRVLGIGNSLAGDDAAGLVAAQRLQERLEGRAAVIPVGMASHALLQLLEGARAAVLIDAVRSGASAGTIHRLDLSGHDGPARLRQGIGRTSHTIGTGGGWLSHGSSLSETLALGDMLGLLPSRLILYGIETESMIMGEGLSPAVVRALERVVEDVCRDVEAAQCTKPTS